VFIAGLVSVGLRTWLFVQVGRAAGVKAQRLSALARFQSEAQGFFRRAQEITDNANTPPLEDEAATWEKSVSAWLTDHLPAYGPTFLASSRVETIHYWAPGMTSTIESAWPRERICLRTGARKRMENDWSHPHQRRGGGARLRHTPVQVLHAVRQVDNPDGGRRTVRAPERRLNR
jgi:hypothetical protein